METEGCWLNCQKWWLLRTPAEPFCSRGLNFPQKKVYNIFFKGKDGKVRFAQKPTIFWPLSLQHRMQQLFKEGKNGPQFSHSLHFPFIVGQFSRKKKRKGERRPSDARKPIKLGGERREKNGVRSKLCNYYCPSREPFLKFPSSFLGSCKFFRLWYFLVRNCASNAW